jgi:hypothetical protein
MDALMKSQMKCHSTQRIMKLKSNEVNDGLKLAHLAGIELNGRISKKSNGVNESLNFAIQLESS